MQAVSSQLACIQSRSGRRMWRCGTCLARDPGGGGGRKPLVARCSDDLQYTYMDGLSCELSFGWFDSEHRAFASDPDWGRRANLERALNQGERHELHVDQQCSIPGL
jgi:hypothetical protein